MTPAEIQTFRKEFFRQLTLGPLEPDDKRYVRLYDLPELRADDPVQLLRFAIDANPPPTAQLVSGFRGTGKSTELRRLRKELQLSGHVVLLCDIEDYLNTGQALEPVEFLYAFALAVSGAIVESFGVGDPLREGYVERLKSFFARTEVEAPELNANLKVGGDLEGAKVEATAGAKLVLKDNPSFKERARRRWQGSLGALVQEVHTYVRDLLHAYAPGRQPVVILDSVEHIQGTLDDAAKVQASIEKLFTAHSDMLHFPGVHAVYTVHPYLKIKYANIDDYFPYGGLADHPDAEGARAPDRASPLDQPRRGAAQGRARRLPQRRRPARRVVEPARPRRSGRRRLDALVLASGGHLRDLMRLLAEVVRRSRDLPVSAEVFDAALNHVRNQALPVADDDALWLAEIARSHTTCLPLRRAAPGARALPRYASCALLPQRERVVRRAPAHPRVVLTQAAAVRARRAAQAAKGP